jgi:hypothetical protein
LDSKRVTPFALELRVPSSWRQFLLDGVSLILLLVPVPAAAVAVAVAW